MTFVNLETSQNKNAGKSLMGKLYLTKEKMSSYEVAQISSLEPTTTYNSITANLNVSSVQQILQNTTLALKKCQVVQLDIFKNKKHI